MEQAEPGLISALELAHAVGSPPPLWKSHVALAELRVAQGRPEEARREYAAALAVIDEVAAGIADPERRERYLRSAGVSAVRAHESRGAWRRSPT